MAAAPGRLESPAGSQQQRCPGVGGCRRGHLSPGLPDPGPVLSLCHITLSQSSASRTHDQRLFCVPEEKSQCPQLPLLVPELPMMASICPLLTLKLRFWIPRSQESWLP